MYLTAWCFTIEDRASRAMMLVLVLYYKVFVITLNAKSTEILGCLVLWLVGNEIKFCDILSPLIANLKTYGFKATKRRTCYSIYIRYPCGNIQGSCILHLHHVCMGVLVICDRNTTCSVIYTQVYTCHVHVSTVFVKD